jgi:hypothetical protein
MQNLSCPWYYGTGNHEVQSATSENVLRSKVNQPTNGPPGHEELVYSFDHENAHFVSLNSNHYGEFHHVQRAWLTTDLATTTKPHVFVMSHEPAYPKGPHVGSSLDVYPTERDDFWNTMTNAGVRMYFCGHEHLYARSKHGSIYQIINGTCGAPIHTGVAGTIGAYHYVVVTVNGYSVHGEAKDDNGGLLDSWDYSLPAPVPISSIKALPDGSPVSLARKTVTVGTDQLASTFYIEDDNRSSGMKVYGSGISVEEGDQVDVSGTISTQSGERTITSPTVTVYPGPYPVPQPLSMLNRMVGGGSLNVYTPGVTGGADVHNTGLLIQAWGVVTYVDILAKYFYVDDACGLQDGSGHAGMLVHCGGRTVGNDISLPSVGQYLLVTGISSRRVSGSNVIPAIRPRTQSDIAVVN